MAETYLEYYRQHTWRAVPKLLIGALIANSRLRRLSLVNRYRDYLGLAGKPDLLSLHRRLNEHLAISAQTWSSYDYGEGYFYQSMPRIGVSGLRNTAARVEAMNLQNLVAGKRVLEIGCNSGFLALLMAERAAHVTGMDVNPHLIDIARDTAAYLGLKNVQFDVGSFEDFTAPEPFDVVLSFANHHTYDGNTRQSIEEYFAKCRDLLAPGGLFLFESHTPAYEGAGLAGVIDTIGRLFTIREKKTLSGGTFLDRGRTFIVAGRPA